MLVCISSIWRRRDENLDNATWGMEIHTGYCAVSIPTQAGAFGKQAFIMSINEKPAKSNGRVLDENGAVHLTMASWFPHKPLPEVVVFLFCFRPLFQEGAAELGKAFDDDPGRFTARVHFYSMDGICCTQ